MINLDKFKFNKFQLGLFFNDFSKFQSGLIFFNEF